MECTLAVDFTLFEQGSTIAYKYLVCCSTHDINPYEVLHGAPGKKGAVIDRMLEISNFKAQGIHGMQWC